MAQNPFQAFTALIFDVFDQFIIEKESTSTFNKSAYFEFSGVEKDTIIEWYNQTYSKSMLPYPVDPYDWFVIIAATIPLYYPDVYKGIGVLRQMNEHNFAILGGRYIGDSKAIYPTGETIIFLLAGHYIERRLHAESLFEDSGLLMSQTLVKLADVPEGVSRLAGMVHPSAELVAKLKGKPFVPAYNHNFPASRENTLQSWDDLVLDYDTHEALEELVAWLEHHTSLKTLELVSRKFKRGYRALFYGPPGTGKTFTASLLGKKYGMDVYRIDLSMVVSKWVGETEKNLKNIFDQAEHKNWILLFDEAEALFGKRTQNNSSNDRYANQEVAYLLQRIEDFPGLIILASNLKANMDKAFTRRFQSMIYFPMPGENERKTLWNKAFSAEIKLDTEISIREISNKYELSGGTITNVLRYCSLMALNDGRRVVLKDELERGIKRELAKDGKLA